MNINETHISLLLRAFENDPLFIHLNLNQNNNDKAARMIKFIIRRNLLLDGFMLTDHAAEPSYLAILDRPGNLRRITVMAKARLQIEMFLLIFHLPFHLLRFLSKYQKEISAAAPREPHYYLTMIGVDPIFQGKGIGRKVLDEVHKRAESSQPPYPVALDTENLQNVSFYESFGYELKDTKVIDGLKVYCMTRPAK